MRNEKHGWLGVAIQDVTPRIAREKDLHVKSGALVNSVTAPPAFRRGPRYFSSTIFLIAEYAAPPSGPFTSMR